LPVKATDGDYWIVAGQSAVYKYDGATWTDISSATGYGTLTLNDRELWTSCQIGKIPVVNNSKLYPEYYVPGSPLQPLIFDATRDWSDVNQKCKVIRAHKNILFGLHLDDAGVDSPDTYRWSHPADTNGIPSSWDETDRFFLAGKASLGGDGGKIIDGASLGDRFYLYSEKAVDVLDYTGDVFVWNRREVSNVTGVLSKECIVQQAGLHFLIVDGDIVVNNGQELKSIASNRVKKRINNNLNAEFYNRAFAVGNEHLKEVWFCFPEANSQYVTTAYIYNTDTDTWSIKELSQDVLLGAAYGKHTYSDTAFDSVVGTFQDQFQPFGSTLGSPLNNTIVGIDASSGYLVTLDPKYSQEDLDTIIERTNVPVEGHVKVTTITSIIPHIKASGAVSIQVGSHDFAGSPVRWKAPIAFDPNTQRKISVRTTGELHAWRVSSIGSVGFELSGMDIIYEEAGLR
jgi:hypothetical protein